MNYIDLVVGISAIYLVLSVVVSAVNELISAFLSWRSSHLESSICSMIGKAQQVELYAHPLIKSTTALGKLPAYISSSTFADAVADMSGIADASSIGSEAVGKAILAMGSDNPLRPIVSCLWSNAAGSSAVFKKGLARWFDSAMDRFSGEYVRRTHMISFLIAIIVTLGLNINSVKVFNQLWTDSTLRTGIANAATSSTGSIADRAAAVSKELNLHKLPVGWPSEDDVELLKPSTWPWLGWTITIFAASLGSPFWFDVLNGLANVRSTGPKPTKVI